MIAQCVNMVPDWFIWQGGDVHLYSNHIKQAWALADRNPLPLSKIKLNPTVQIIDDFTLADISIENYQHHPAMPAPVAV